MSHPKEREVPVDDEVMPSRRKELMPGYSYYFSDCSSIISSVKCAVSVDEDKSRSVSPNFGNLTNINTNLYGKGDVNPNVNCKSEDLNSKEDDLNPKEEDLNPEGEEEVMYSLGETVIYDSNNVKSYSTSCESLNGTTSGFYREINTFLKPNSGNFDQEDELASASIENYSTMNLDNMPTFAETDLEKLPNSVDFGESLYKFNRWCKKYSSGNIEMFKRDQQEKMSTILEENSLKIGDLKSKNYDEFPVKVLYSKGTTPADNKFDLNSVKKGEVLVERFRVDEVLGTTTFSRVVKATEMSSNVPVCLKIVHPDYFDQALDEILFLKLLNSKDENDSNCIVRLLDSFLYSGAVFLVLELLGENLFEATKDFYVSSFKDFFTHSRPKRWNLNQLKHISRDVLKALNFIHGLGIINCDLKPENVVLVNSENKTQNENIMIKLVDFGSSCFIQDQLNTYVQSRSYRAPEVVLGLPYDTQIDIWSLGCILCELYLGRILFPSDNSASLVASMVSLLGPPPAYMLQHKMNSMFIILPNGNIADLNVPDHILNQSPYYNRLDRSSLYCNVSASDSSKCSHVTYNKWDNATVNLEPTLDDNSSGLEDSSDYNRNSTFSATDNSNSLVDSTFSFLDKRFKITNYDSNPRMEDNSLNNTLDCKIKLDIRHNRNPLTKFMRIIQPTSATVESMLDSNKSTELSLFCDFIKGLLQYDPLDRLTASAALQHPFILSSNI
uniref:Serine/threonine protein kinase, putative n=1 Tax=Theileria annulata TaxID=5874 RepID=A0A3B0NK14_THEAN